MPWRRSPCRSASRIGHLDRSRRRRLLGTQGSHLALQAASGTQDSARPRLAAVRSLAVVVNGGRIHRVFSSALLPQGQRTWGIRRRLAAALALRVWARALRHIGA